MTALETTIIALLGRCEAAEWAIANELETLPKCREAFATAPSAVEIRAALASLEKSGRIEKRQGEWFRKPERVKAEKLLF